MGELAKAIAGRGVYLFVPTALLRFDRYLTGDTSSANHSPLDRFLGFPPSSRAPFNSRPFL
ncbi:hypothetical protein BRADI_3g28886v3 [Brachypodium distachyon]|uniref:Uncharacterized protein n=1 Tax=Brachypodium distachyon TaxID=15368 RepID=A0A2K2CZV1_BRADI|nr:hypothetical protein BRADI_3g28886v3 [Brachypodium distachyon]